MSDRSHTPERAFYDDRLGSVLPGLLERIDVAARTAGRRGEEVRLIAVTKGHPPVAVSAAVSAGLRDVGENRVEEMALKVAEVGRAGVQWHMIGHVQTRRVRAVLPLADLIHSVDSVRLAEKLSAAAVEAGTTVRVLAQVNTSGEQTKSGFGASSASDEILRLVDLPALRLEGLMTMAPLEAEPALLGRTFGGLRRLLEEIRTADSRVGRELSMGMTGDFEVAIQEGSTMVRIGTALFGERVP